MSYFMSFEFYGTILYWVSCIQFMHISFIYTMYSYIFVCFGGICTPCICYTLYNVFVHYMVFLLGVLLYFMHIISILGFFFLLVFCVHYA